MKIKISRLRNVTHVKRVKFIVCLIFLTLLANINLVKAQPQMIAGTQLAGNQNNYEGILPVALATDGYDNIIAVVNHDDNWYDPGNKCIKYNSSLGSPVDLSAILTNKVAAIEADQAGNIYFVRNSIVTVNPDQALIEFGKIDSGLGYVKQISGTSHDYATKIAVDHTGNIYIVGHYAENSLDFDSGTGTFYLGSIGNFIAKYDANGAFLNAFGLPCTIKGLTIDNGNNIIITGTFNGTVDFDPGAGVQSRTNSKSNVFIAKYSQQGDFIWVDHLTSDYSFSMNPNALVTDAFGNIIVTGSITGGPTDFNPESGVANLTSNGPFDIVLAKYSPNGSYLFAFNIGNTDHDWANDVTTDAWGNIYSTGYYTGQVDFDPSSNTTNLNGQGTFLSKYSSDGAFQWALSNGAGQGQNVQIDTHQNIIYTRNGYNVNGTAITYIAKYNQPPSIISLSLPQGPVGTTIQITGKNFTTIPSNNVVKFNGIPATIISSSVTGIVTTVPIGATTGPITVTVGGLTATSSSNFIVTVPAITSASSGTYGGTINLATNTGGSTGLVTYSVANGTGSATLSGKILSLTGAGTVTVTANIAADANYTAASVSQPITINKKDQIISFTNFGWKNYGDAPFTLSASSNSGLPVTLTSSDNLVASISGNTVTVVSAGTCVITASQAGNTNYNSATSVDKNLKVNKAIQTVTFQLPQQAFYCGTTVTLNATSNSGLPITFTSSSPNAPVTGNVITLNKSGTTVIRATQEGNANYNVAWVERTMNVNALSQTITFNPLPSLCINSSITLSASASSGLPIEYDTGNSRASITGNVLTAVSAGSVSIHAYQDGDGCYQRAYTASQPLTILANPCSPGGRVASDNQEVTPSDEPVFADVEEWIVYPNPARDEFTIQLPASVQKGVAIQIMNPLGQFVREYILAVGDQKKTINTENLSEGLYIIQLGEGETAVRKKVIVTHK